MFQLLFLPNGMKTITLHLHKASLFRYVVLPMKMVDTYDLETRSKSSRMSMLLRKVKAWNCVPVH